MSAGAKAGVGVGVAIATLAAIGVIAWLISRRRRWKLLAQQQPCNDGIPELHGREKYEISGHQTTELAHGPEGFPAEMYQDPGAVQRQHYEMGVE
jgi:hypothetical protein